ncbi:MAG TPA: DUF309 domain-containing protein [Bacteroidota bacterium]|nr:DUF309 domain-containing protein [Bacteroidota bacterium]
MDEAVEVQRGMELFNAQRFFEAHDVWEALWTETHGARRLLYQGLIQLAVAYYHAGNGNASGATHQLTRALDKFSRADTQTATLNLDEVLPLLNLHLRIFTDAAEGVGEPTVHEYPVLRIADR